MISYKREDVINFDLAIYHIAIKLREYEDALDYAYAKLAELEKLRKNSTSTIETLRIGGLTVGLQAIQRHFPEKLADYKEKVYLSAEKDVYMLSYEMGYWHGIKNALISTLLNDDHAFIENYIKKKEQKSRKRIEQVFVFGNKRKLDELKEVFLMGMVGNLIRMDNETAERLKNAEISLYIRATCDWLRAVSV